MPALGMMYEGVSGIPKDLKMACAWFTTAAQYGDVSMARELAKVKASLSPEGLAACKAKVGEMGPKIEEARKRAKEKEEAY